MFTIEEIKKRRIEGKRKWGSSLILFIKDKLEENLPIESIAEHLAETHNLTLTVGDLYQLKSKYYLPTPQNKTGINRSNCLQTKHVPVEQNADAEKLYKAIYRTENQGSSFDLGKDF